MIVNPVAGVGGPAGLKGSDGSAIQAAAIERGSSARAEQRAMDALSVIAHSLPDAHILTAAGAMGEDAVLSAGLAPEVVYRPATSTTCGRDTTNAATALAEAGATLVLFAGGDGTARDVSDAKLARSAVLGIPAGVKMYSGCFAVSPVVAGTIATRWATAGGLAASACDVLDIDEEQIRHGRAETTLHGMVQVPVEPGRTQARKSPTLGSQIGAVRFAASGAVERISPDVTYLLGPGSTIMEVGALLGIAGTLLGVDVVRNGVLVMADASNRDLLAILGGGKAKVILTVIGGQGFLLGRGNQQISSDVLRKIGANPLMVVATEDKLIDLGGRPLLVDTGDPIVDRSLAGHIEVITGPRLAALYPVEAPECEGTE